MAGGGGKVRSDDGSGPISAFAGISRESGGLLVTSSPPAPGSLSPFMSPITLLFIFLVG